MTDDTNLAESQRVPRRRKHARAKELREAALALFVEKGFEATRTEEIAARAGLSKGALYLYYPSKENLLHAVIDSPVLAAFISACSSARCGGTHAHTLRHLLSVIWTQLQDEDVCNVLKLAVVEAPRFPVGMDIWLRKVVGPLCSLIADVVSKGVWDGEFRKVDPHGAAHSLLLPMFMVCLQRGLFDKRTPAEQCPDERFIPQHVGLVLRGLGIDPQMER